LRDRQPAQRSWLDVRLRQLRNPPPPIWRAVIADLAVALLGGALLYLYALANEDSDLSPLVVLYVAVVIMVGSALTYLWVELPSGASGVRRRSAWSGLLGLFAAVPIAYLVLVLVFQVLPRGG
jgi:hypothetical protein